jgi:glycosyltransferase involved in cell wall biosynthesis
MRVLWITYWPLGRAAEIIENKKTESGTWIDAMRHSLTPCKIELAQACIASKSVKIQDTDGTIYYGIEGIKRSFGQSLDLQEADLWKKVITDFDPSVIMIWGTEWGNGAEVIKAANGVPTIFFIQGVLGRIVEHAVGEIKYVELKKHTNFFTRLKWIHYINVNKKQKAQAIFEREMVSLSNGVITDNDWADSYYKLIVDRDSIFHVSLPVNPIFLSGRYDIHTIERYSVFSVACNNPAKGIHILLKAIAIVKKKYADVKLYLPGSVNYREPKILFKQPYLEYLDGLINDLGIKDNVVFCGMLSPNEMKDRLLSCNVFVMPSCVENHSSSLREAMYLGVPTISTEVGSVHEFVTHNINGLLYRYTEYEVLADEICSVFTNDESTIKMGDNAYNSIRGKYPQERIGEQMMDVYNTIIKK